MRALGDLGYAVVGLDTDPPEVMKAQRGLLRRIQGKLYRLGWECNSPGDDMAGVNVNILDHFSKSTWGILELIEKTRYYLTREDQRKRIAKSGRERCLRDGYSNKERLADVLARIP